MAEVVEVVASLGDSVIAIVHGAHVTVGESGEVYAPFPTRAFALADVYGGAWSASSGLLRIEVRRTSAAERVPRAPTRRTVAAYVAASLVAHLVVLMTLPGTHGDGGSGARSGFVPLSAGDHASSEVSDAAAGRASTARGGSPSHPAMTLAEAPGTLRGDLVGEIAGHAAVDLARDVPGDSRRGEPVVGRIPGTGEPAVDRARGLNRRDALDKAIIRRSLRSKLAAFQSCYESARAELTSAIALSFVIDATGRPRDVHASGVRADVDACVASVVESIRFPRSRNATQVTYPLSFHVAGS